MYRLSILSSCLGYFNGAPQREQNRLAMLAPVPHRTQNLIPCGGGAAGLGTGTGVFMSLSSKTDTSPGKLNMSFAFFGLCTAPQWGQIFSPAVYQWQVSQNMGASLVQ